VHQRIIAVLRSYLYVGSANDVLWHHDNAVEVSIAD